MAQLSVLVSSIPCFVFCGLFGQVVVLSCLAMGGFDFRRVFCYVDARTVRCTDAAARAARCHCPTACPDLLSRRIVLHTCCGRYARTHRLATIKQEVQLQDYGASHSLCRGSHASARGQGGDDKVFTTDLGSNGSKCPGNKSSGKKSADSAKAEKGKAVFHGRRFKCGEARRCKRDCTTVGANCADVLRRVCVRHWELGRGWRLADATVSYESVLNVVFAWLDKDNVRVSYGPREPSCHHTRTHERTGSSRKRRPHVHGMRCGRREAHTRGPARDLRGRRTEAFGVRRASCEGWKWQVAGCQW